MKQYNEFSGLSFDFGIIVTFESCALVVISISFPLSSFNEIVADPMFTLSLKVASILSIVADTSDDPFTGVLSIALALEVVIQLWI